jgi:RNA polymerase sigma-70 factor, ECF subfamily
MSGDVPALVDHLFRREAGRLVARLVRRLGGRLDLAEDAVQHAMVQALRTWPFHGVPDRPDAWLARVAHNVALDALRAARRTATASRELAEEAGSDAGTSDPPAVLAGELDDDRLALMFACSHPIVPHASRVALTLNVVGGFGVREIARAFVVDAASMAQRLVRAKRLLSDHAVRFEVPAGGEIEERLDAVLQVIYLLFNEGYDASSGEDWVRSDLCDEALRLVELVVAHPATVRPAAHALAALLYLLAARLPGRLDTAGALILLDEQDRGRWDRRAIAVGLRHLAAAARGDQLSSYHLQAEIAALHAAAPSFGQTHWAEVVALYDQLLALDSSPVIALNRAVALAEARGATAGLAAVAELERGGALSAYLPYHAVRGELLRRAGEMSAAAMAFARAAALPCSEPQRHWLRHRQEQCEWAASRVGR